MASALGINIRSPYTPYSIYLRGAIGFRVSGLGPGLRTDVETCRVLEFRGSGLGFFLRMGARGEGGARDLGDTSVGDMKGLCYEGLPKG